MTRPADLLARLRGAEWLRRPETQLLLALLDGASGRTKAVGGIVRDTLLEMPRGRTDIDFATELLPHEVTVRANREGITVHPTGIDHGTVTLRLNDLVVEVTTLREDVETDGRRAQVRFGSDWRRDAERRDFTLNALYATSDGQLFDPLSALDDCLQRRVRFIGEASRRIEEDRLRVYRFFRFSASHAGEKFDPVGLAACRAASATLGNLAAERIGAEMRRMLSLPRIANTLKLMATAEILDVDAEVIGLLYRYERRGRRPDFLSRLALLLSRYGADRLKTLWRLSNEDIRSAEAILTVAELLRELKVNEAAYRHPAALADGIEVAAVLADWGEAGKAAVMEQLQTIEIPRFPLRGADLLQRGMAPGRAVGAELERLEHAWIESGFALDREALLSRLRPEG